MKKILSFCIGILISLSMCTVAYADVVVPANPLDELFISNSAYFIAAAIFLAVIAIVLIILIKKHKKRKKQTVTAVAASDNQEDEVKL